VIVDVGRVRLGVNLPGPFSTSIGVRGDGPFAAACTVCGVIGLILAYKAYVLIAGGVLLLIAVAVLSRRVRRAAVAEDATREEYSEWCEAPPPPLTLPGRFTDTWFVNNLPILHPGQGPMLLSALQARGWSDDKIIQLVKRHPGTLELY
jgi:hypothetical protein